MPLHARCLACRARPDHNAPSRALTGPANAAPAVPGLRKPARALPRLACRAVPNPAAPRRARRACRAEPRPAAASPCQKPRLAAPRLPRLAVPNPAKPWHAVAQPRLPRPALPLARLAQPDPATPRRACLARSCLPCQVEPTLACLAAACLARTQPCPAPPRLPAPCRAMPMPGLGSAYRATPAASLPCLPVHAASLSLSRMAPTLASIASKSPLMPNSSARPRARSRLPAMRASSSASTLAAIAF